jgi:hypothetical protein
MTGLQILLLAVALLAIVAVLTAVWIRRQRIGGVLIADRLPAPQEPVTQEPAVRS